MGILDYVYRLKPEAGDTQPHNEIGGAQVLSGSPTLVDLGGGVMAWRFTAAALATIAARAMDTTGSGGANSGFTMAVRCAVTTAPSQDSRLYCYSASSDPLQAGLVVRRGTTSGKRYSQLRGASASVINGIFTEWTPGAVMTTDVIRVVVNDPAPVVPGDNDGLDVWNVSNAGLTPDVSVYTSVGTNLGTFQFLHVNPLAGVMDVRDILVWHEELSAADCDALRDDLDAALVASPVLTGPSGAATGPTQATIGVTSDTTGSISSLILPSATAAPADAATLIADGAAVVRTIAAAGTPQTFAITGLTTNTAVKVHWAMTGSNVQSSAAFTPNTLAISGAALSAQTGTAGAAFAWTGATPESLITNAGNGSGAWAATAGVGASGVTVNSSTGILVAGSLGTAGSYTITLQRADGSTVPGAQTVTKTVGLTIGASGDVTAPTMSAAGVTGGVLSATGSITSNETGSLWTKMDGAATAADPGAGNEAGAGWTSQSMLAASNAVSFGAQPAGLRYGHFLGVDAAGNRAAVVNASGTVSAGAGLAGFDFHSNAGCRFGAIAGSLVGLAPEVGVSIVIRVYNATTGALVATLPAAVTNSSGYLPRATHASLVAATSYTLNAVWPDGAVYAFNLAAT